MKKLNKEKLNKLLTERLAGNIKEAKTAGAEIIVMQSGEELCHITMGYKNAIKGEMLTPGCMYRLASMTKPVTAVAVLIGVQNGWFSLDDYVKDYLPEFSDMEVAVLKDEKIVIDHKAKSDLKIWQMLSHCSGILAETELGNMILERGDKSIYTSIDTMLEFTSRQPLAFDPEEYTAYTAFASFDALAKIIENKSGVKYSEFIQKNIFEPLGIKNITFHPTDEQWEKFVTLHDRSDSKTLVTVDSGKHIYEGNELTYECAGGGLAGTAEDYAKFAQMLCNGGSFNGVQIVSKELIEEMKKPRVPDFTPGREPNDSWGFGVRVKVHEDWLPEGIFGWSGAYGTHFWVDQENEIVAVYLRNMRWYDSQGPGKLGAEFEKDVMSCTEQ